MIIYKYRVWCSVDSKWEYVWSSTEPTVCPTNAAHGIDSAKTVIVEQTGDEDPRTSDGKRIFAPNLFRGDVELNYVGVGDDITNGTRYAGQKLEASSNAIEDVTVEWQFMEWVYLAGGLVNMSGGKLGDTISYKVFAPATVGTSNPGAGAYAKLDLGGGANLYVPPGTPGAGAADWDLDLTEKLNANVNFSKVVPVPAPKGDGFFDWNSDDETVSYVAGGTGGYNLYDFQLDLANFVKDVSIMGNQAVSLTVPAIKPKRILPHWKHSVTIHHAVASLVEVAWHLYLARKKTA